MRLAVALALLLLGLKAAPAETKYRDSPPAGASIALSSLEWNVAIGGPDDRLVLAEPFPDGNFPADGADAASESSATAAGAPGEQSASHSVPELCHTLLASAKDNDLPVPFFANLIWQESRLQLDTVSRAGALGIAQFMPEVAIEVGLADPFDPHQAIPASARFLRMLRQHFGNLGFVAAAYNAGTHRVSDWLAHRRALPRETQSYVVQVTGRTAETWRKSPPHDSQLTFAKPLPCRQLPAFAELEQAHAQITLADDADGSKEESGKTTAKRIQRPDKKRAATAGTRLAGPPAARIAGAQPGGRQATTARASAPRGKRRVAQGG